MAARGSSTTNPVQCFLLSAAHHFYFCTDYVLKCQVRCGVADVDLSGEVWCFVAGTHDEAQSEHAWPEMVKI